MPILISVRRGYWYVCFFGFACNYMIRVNLNIAITAMIQTPAISSDRPTSGSVCIDPAVAPLGDRLDPELGILDPGVASALRFTSGLQENGTRKVS